MSAIVESQHPPATVNGEGVRAHRWTRAEYHRLGEEQFLKGKRTELIRGEIIDMSPRNWPHVVACRKVAEILERAFAGIGWVARQEPLNLIESEPEPDVAVIEGRFEDYADHPTKALLVVEVADSTFKYDTTTKADLYAEKGIPEYWVLDLDGRQLIVFRDPTSNASGLKYRTRQTLAVGQSITPLNATSAQIRRAHV